MIISISVDQAKGETLLGAGKAQVSLRHYANEFGTDAAKRLMVNFGVGSGKYS